MDMEINQSFIVLNKITKTKQKQLPLPKAGDGGIHNCIDSLPVKFKTAVLGVVGSGAAVDKVQGSVWGMRYQPCQGQ